MQKISQFTSSKRETSIAGLNTYRIVFWRYVRLQNQDASEQYYTADTTADLESSTFIDSSPSLLVIEWVSSIPSTPTDSNPVVSWISMILCQEIKDKKSSIEQWRGRFRKAS